MDSSTTHNYGPAKAARTDVSNDSLTSCQYTTKPNACKSTGFSRRAGLLGHWLQIGGDLRFEYNRLDLPVENLPPSLEGFRIIHLSDAHLKPRWARQYDDLIERFRENQPDLILFTGDMVDHKLDHRKSLPIVERFVTQLQSRLGIYAITGNHDGDLLGPRLGSWGIHFIPGRFIKIESAEAAIELVGLPGVKRRDFDPDFVQSIPPRRRGVPRIILGHYPDQIRHVTCLKAEAMLVGHTHGGQICLPGEKALMSHDALPKSMARGVHRFEDTLLVVNRGFGTTRWPIRIFCHPEVIELQLRNPKLEVRNPKQIQISE